MNSIDMVLDINEYLDARLPAWESYEKMGYISYVSAHPGRAPAHVTISIECPDVVEHIKRLRSE
jgi:hypothetical protein